MLASARLYLDTSVLSAYYDEHSPDRREATIAFWKTLKHLPVAVSAVVVEELALTPDLSRREELLALARP